MGEFQLFDERTYMKMDYSCKKLFVSLVYQLIIQQAKFEILSDVDIKQWQYILQNKHRYWFKVKLAQKTKHRYR